jgi:hypothetical protein
MRFDEFADYCVDLRRRDLGRSDELSTSFVHSLP